MANVKQTIALALAKQGVTLASHCLTSIDRTSLPNTIRLRLLSLIQELRKVEEELCRPIEANVGE